MSIAAKKLEVAPMKQQRHYDQESRLTRVEILVEMLTNNMTEIKDSLKKIDIRLEIMNDKFDTNHKSINEKVDIFYKSLVDKIDIIRKEAWSQMRWVLLFIVAVFTSPFLEHIMKLFGH